MSTCTTLAALAVLAGCKGDEPPKAVPAPSPVVVPADAAIVVAPPDASLVPLLDLQCTFTGAKEMIRLTTDASMNGVLERIASKSYRDIQVKVVQTSPDTADLVFAGYVTPDRPHRNPPIKDPPMVVGESVVATLLRTAELTRIRGVSIDLSTAMRAQTGTKAYPCATANGDFAARYPNEFVR